MATYIKKNKLNVNINMKQDPKLLQLCYPICFKGEIHINPYKMQRIMETSSITPTMSKWKWIQVCGSTIKTIHDLWCVINTACSYKLENSDYNQINMFHDSILGHEQTTIKVWNSLKNFGNLISPNVYKLRQNLSPEETFEIKSCIEAFNAQHYRFTFARITSEADSNINFTPFIYENNRVVNEININMADSIIDGDTINYHQILSDDFTNGWLSNFVMKFVGGTLDDIVQGIVFSKTIVLRNGYCTKGFRIRVLTDSKDNVPQLIEYLTKEFNVIIPQPKMINSSQQFQRSRGNYQYHYGMNYTNEKSYMNVNTDHTNSNPQQARRNRLEKMTMHFSHLHHLQNHQYQKQNYDNTK